MTAPLGPDYELQVACERVLRASVDLKDLAGSPLRLYTDTVPVTARKPYITIGEGETIGDYTSFSIHIWADGFRAAKQIEAVVRTMLHQTAPALTTWRCLSLRHVSSHGPMRDPDGVTKHTVMTFTAYITSPVN